MSTIPYISTNDLNSKLPIGYYWSDDFTPHFYIELAKKGLISTSANYADYGDILLPEMQEAYAVLNFNDLHIGKKVKKLFNREYSLKISQDLDTFLPLLSSYHGDDCWFTDTYIKLMYSLKNFTLEKDNFRLNTTLLYENNNITSGEIGYYIGSTYTSLTGFFNPKFNNWGTFQLILLAKHLQQSGIDFWNLGHPYMEYKKKLGANILENQEFLTKWLPSTISIL